jgi:hypothetical protein
MKKHVLEKSFVVVLFVLVMIVFSMAERDTQKLFKKYNTKSTVEVPKQNPDYTADVSEKPVQIKATRQ